MENSILGFEKLKKEHIGELVKIASEGKLTNISSVSLEKELTNKISWYMVALIDSNPVGFVGIWNIAGEGEIIDIAVSRNFRRRGIAKELLCKAVSFCKLNGIFTLHLEVRESNIPAISLYKSCGFEKVGLRKKYYENTENAILMNKDI